jgi:hypothetical protein
LCAGLINDALITRFSELGREVLDFRPVELISEHPSDDFLRTAVVAGDPCPDWLSVRPLHELEVRVLDFTKGSLLLGMAMNMRSRKRILRSCKELLDDGFDLTGLYLTVAQQATDSRLSPQREVMGRVASVKDGTLALDDAREGLTSLEAASTRLECKPEAFNRCLRHVYGASADRVSAGLDDTLARWRSGPERLKRLETLLDHFDTEPRGRLARDVVEDRDGNLVGRDVKDNSPSATGKPFRHQMSVRAEQLFHT